MMPLHEPFNDYYRDIFVPAIKKAGLQPIRADQIHLPGVIVDQIWKGICESALCLADATGFNSNVMYEIGLAHAIGRPVILTTQNISELPFDFKHFRHIPYKTESPKWDRRLQTEITAALQATLINPGSSVVLPEGKKISESQFLEHYRKALNVLAHHHGRGLRFEKYSYKHQVGKEGENHAIREFTILSDKHPLSWCYFHTGASEDSLPCSWQDLNIQAYDVSKKKKLYALPFVDTPFDKGVIIFLDDELAPCSKRKLQVTYTWPGAWKSLLSTLQDGASYTIEGNGGGIGELTMEIYMRPETVLKIREFVVTPLAGKIDYSKDRSTVLWQFKNPPTNIYWWKIFCEKRK